MTEQPNTAAIRLTWTHRRDWTGNRDWIDPDVAALCDALDAARAERDTAIDAFRLNIKSQLFPGDWMPWKARAEAAEAELARRAQCDGCIQAEAQAGWDE